MAGIDEIEEIESNEPIPENFNPVDEIAPSILAKPKPFTPTEDLGITTVTAKERQLDKIITQIKGYPWKVNYYNNLASVNDTTSPLSVNIDVSIQKYKRIKDMTIYLDSALGNEVQDTKGLEITGTINSGIIPFKEDLVEVTMMSNRRALFTVTAVENVTYMQHTVYKITMKFYNFLELLVEEYPNLISKVVQKLVEDKNYIMDYSSPIILEEDYKQKEDIKELRRDLIRFFYDTFLDRDTKYLSITATRYLTPGMSPDTGHRIIDEYLNDFVRSLVTTDDDNRVIHVRKPSYITFNNRARTILDAIVEKDENFRTSVEYELGFMSSYRGLEPTEEQSVVFMSVSEIVDRNYNHAHGTYCPNIYVRPTPPYTMDYPLNLDNPDEAYIFSRTFYSDEKNNLTNFETMMLRYISNQSVTVDEVIKYCKDLKYWSKYEQFYLTPILLCMLVSFTKNTYSPL